MSALLRAARTVDFDGIYRRHAASVYRYAFAVLGNRADAEDVTQQTFMNAYRAIAQGTKPRKAENWLLTIAHNEIRRHFRTTQGRSLEVELDEELADPAHERSEPSLADVLRALQHLSPAQRSALVMREFEGRSYAEIAETMDLTQGALEGLIFRARRALTDQLYEVLTCAEAEQAVSRRLDGRLPRRDARRLKTHLRECPLCARFADTQKRQGSLLKGLSVMPIPASLHLFRGETATAATGLGASAAAVGGSAAVGVGGASAGVGAAGIATGLVAKAAAVAAAATVAGGVGYGVAAGPDSVTKAERKAAHAAAVAQTRKGARAAEVQAALARGERPGPAPPARARGQRVAAKAKALPGLLPPAAKKSQRKAAARSSSARGKPSLPVKARSTTPAATEAVGSKTPVRRQVGKRVGRVLAKPTPRAQASAKRGAVRPIPPLPERAAVPSASPTDTASVADPGRRGSKL